MNRTLVLLLLTSCIAQPSTRTEAPPESFDGDLWSRPPPPPPPPPKRPAPVAIDPFHEVPSEEETSRDLGKPTESTEQIPDTRNRLRQEMTRSSGPPTTRETFPEAPKERACCKYCSSGKPCGDGCIAVNKTCRVGRGCAC